MPAMELQAQRCRVCGHLDVFPAARCSSCSYLRSPLGLFGEIEADTPPGLSPEAEGAPPRDLSSADSSRLEGEDDRAILDAAFLSVGRLFERVRSEGGTLSDAERAELYESLLLSLLKVEREHLRRALLKEEQSRAKRAHMKQLSLIWVSGWLIGIIFYFALSAL